MIDKFDKPGVLAIIGDVNSGKSNLIYHLIHELNSNFCFNLYTYGLKYKLPSAYEFHSLEELEKIENSIIFIDEFQSLFDLDDRKKKRQIESTLRLIFHKNNVLVLIGLPDNFKKFISSRICVIFYKQVTFENFINGSSVKRNVLNYRGNEKGISILNVDTNEVIIFDGSYKKYDIPYLSKFDSKAKNPEILQKRTEENVQGKCAENVEENI